MRIYKSYLIIALCGALQSCLTEIAPDSITFENLLVVEARITDQLINHEIVLQRSVPVNTDSMVYEENATVSVLINSAEAITFSEQTPGRYVATRPFSALPNADYQLFITTADGNEYKSEIEQMNATPPIDDLYAEFEPFEISAFQGNGVFNQYFDVSNTSTEAKFYLVEWSETYVIRVPFPSTFEWRGGSIVEPRLAGDSVEFCFQTVNSPDIIAVESLIESGKINRFPIRTFDTSVNNALSIRYSLEVKLYALGQNAFSYWQQVASTRENEALLIQQQPGSILGNIENTTDDTKPVLGRFDVLQERSQRIFYSPSDLRDQGYFVIDNNIATCDTTDVVRGPQEEVAEVLTRNPNLDIWFIESGLGNDDKVAVPILVYLPKRCSNCTYYGTNERPTFWID